MTQRKNQAAIYNQIYSLHKQCNIATKFSPDPRNSKHDNSSRNADNSFPRTKVLQSRGEKVMQNTNHCVRMPWVASKK